MFEKDIDVLIENCKKDLLDNQDKKIQKNLKGIKKYLDEDLFDLMIKDALKKVLSATLLINGQDNYDILVKTLENYRINVEAMHLSIMAEVKVRGIDQINRILEIPYSTSIANLAYYILAAFQADASHLFQVLYKGQRFTCDLDEEIWNNEKYASKVNLPELRLRKNAKLELWYDFGDNYRFDINILEIKKHDEVFVDEDANIIEGNGYGIWEDAHRELVLFMHDKALFEQFIEQNGLNRDWYPIDKNEYIPYDTNEDFIDDFWSIHDAYEPSNAESGESLWKTKY